jgi:hypothetical protein
MALQIRRGLVANLPASPADGELLYATDTNTLYVGDSGTAQEISGGSGLANVVEDTSPQLGGNLDVNGNSIVSTSNGNININPNGSGIVSLQGSVVIGDAATNQDGSLLLTTNTYSSSVLAGFTFSQYHETADAVNWTLFRARGTSATPEVVKSGDDLAEIAFAGWDGVTATVGGNINMIVDGPVTSGRIPTKFSFRTNSTTGASVKAELSSTGVWKVNQLGALTGTTITVPTNNNITVGDIKLDQNGLSTINTNASLTLSANGTGAVNVESISIIGNTIDTSDSSAISFLVNTTFSNDLTVQNDLRVTNKVYAESFISTSVGTPSIRSATNIELRAATGVVISGSPLRLASMTSSQRNALVAQNGDLIYNTTTNKFQGYENGAWVNLI